MSLVVLLLCRCGQQETVIPESPPEGLKLTVLDMDDYPSFEDQDDPQAMIRAIDNQLRWLNSADAGREWSFGSETANKDRIAATLRRFKELWQEHGQDAAALRVDLQREFHCFQFTWDGSPDILMTGYFGPIFDGSLKRSDKFAYPLYKPPRDRIVIRPSQFAETQLCPGTSLRKDRVVARLHKGEVLPYFSREDIDENGALRGRGLELVYLADYFEKFSFHVQGGGFVKLAEGGYFKLDYAGTNGQPYRSIGRLLVNEGIISKEKISMQAIESYFGEKPEEVKRVCYANPSYVFYKSDGKVHQKITPSMFPSGSLGFPVTARRSIATDKTYFPGGALAFLEGKQRADDGSTSRFSAFAIDQDTGGAIRRNHIDFFQGIGEDAEARAGLLKDEAARVYFLLLRQPAVN